MRYFLFFLFSLPVLLKAQGFSKRFALGAPATLGFAITQKDGKYYTNSFAGDSMAANFNKSIPIFSCFDSDGNLLYSKMFREVGSLLQIGKNLIQTTDGGFTNCGIYVKNGDAEKRALIIKYDSIGDVEWFKNPVSGNLSDLLFILNDIIQTKDKGFLAVGYIQTSNFATKTILIKTDSVGNEEWRKYYNPRYWALDGYHIYENDSGFIISGTDNNYSFNAQLEAKIHPFMIQIDSIGNVLWDWWYTDDTKTGASFSGIRTDDGGYILSGYKIIGQQPQGGNILTNACIMKIDLSKNTVWKKTIADFNINKTPVGLINEVLIDDRGDLIVAGRIVNQFGPYSRSNVYGLIAKISREGDSLWAKGYTLTSDTSVDGANMNTFNGMVANGDGGFTVVGESNELFNSGTGQQLWLMRTDSNGCITPTDCGVTKEVTGIDEAWDGAEFLLYPNPANNEGHIQLNEAKADGYTISDLSGRLVMQDRIESREVVIQTGVLPTGMYLVSIQLKGRTLGVKRLVIN